tara:strand:- start:71 stop:223 length:153 start_codon:yes stop_codon:yes gene_type:complete
MSNKESSIEEEADHYEEIFTQESLDQYEGLLNQLKNKEKRSKKNLQEKKK